MKLRLVLLTLLSVFICSTVSFAAIIIDNRTGATKILMPDGKELVIKSNEPMPSIIPDGAIITIINGSATVSTTGKSTVSVTMGTYTIQLKEGSKINLTLNPDGTVTSTIIAGQASISRTVEPYRGPKPPAGPELGPMGGGENGRDISQTH